MEEVQGYKSIDGEIYWTKAEARVADAKIEARAEIEEYLAHSEHAERQHTRVSNILADFLAWRAMQ